MHRLEEFKQMLMRELEDIAKKGELSAGSLDAIDKLTHSIKSICYILDEMEEDEGRSGARGRGRNAKRDSMGRYSNDMMYDYDRYNMSGRYSRDKDELMQQLRDMEKHADDSEMKHMIKNWIRQVED